MRYVTILSPIYFSILALEMYASYTGNHELIYVTKPLLMPILLLLFWLNNEDNTKHERLFFSLGLLFSLSGDVFLMLNGKMNFIFGLLSFLVAHIGYVISFTGRVKQAGGTSINKLLLVIPFAIYVAIFLIFLFPHFMAKPATQSLFGPVAVYGCVLGTMSYMAFMRRKAVSQVGFLLVFVGSLFFVASDSSLSTAIFVGRFPYQEFVIMITYGIAQYLLTVGTIKK